MVNLGVIMMSNKVNVSNVGDVDALIETLQNTIQKLTAENESMVKEIKRLMAHKRRLQSEIDELTDELAKVKHSSSSCQCKYND